MSKVPCPQVQSPWPRQVSNPRPLNPHSNSLTTNQLIMQFAQTPMRFPAFLFLVCASCLTCQGIFYLLIIISGSTVEVFGGMGSLQLTT